MKRFWLQYGTLVFFTLLILFSLAATTSRAAAPTPTPNSFESDIFRLGGKSIEDVASKQGLVGVIQLIINAVTAVVIALGLVMIVISGFVYMAAEGNESKIGTAKSMLIAAAYGITFALLAQLLLNTISPQFAQEAFKPFFGKPK